MVYLTVQFSYFSHYWQKCVLHAQQNASLLFSPTSSIKVCCSHFPSWTCHKGARGTHRATNVSCLREIQQCNVFMLYLTKTFICIYLYLCIFAFAHSVVNVSCLGKRNKRFDVFGYVFKLKPALRGKGNTKGNSPYHQISEISEAMENSAMIVIFGIARNISFQFRHNQSSHRHNSSGSLTLTCA